jgi:hypothetical protein
MLHAELVRRINVAVLQFDHGQGNCDGAADLAWRPIPATKRQPSLRPCLQRSLARWRPPPGGLGAVVVVSEEKRSDVNRRCHGCPIRLETDAGRCLPPDPTAHWRGGQASVRPLHTRPPKTGSWWQTKWFAGKGLLSMGWAAGRVGLEPTTWCSKATKSLTRGCMMQIGEVRVWRDTPRTRPLLRSTTRLASSPSPSSRRRVGMDGRSTARELI